MKDLAWSVIEVMCELCEVWYEGCVARVSNKCEVMCKGQDAVC